MGTLYYGGSADAIEIEDVALAHLKVVIGTKLRRGESFMLSWRHPEDQPRGRSAMWLQPAIPLRFVFDDPEPIELNRAWIEELANSANSSGGMTAGAEHFDPPPGEDQPADTAPSVGTVEVDELFIAHLTVAGREISLESAAPELDSVGRSGSLGLAGDADPADKSS